MKKFVINALLIAGSLGAAFALAIGVDRLVGRLAAHQGPAVGILFKPNSEAHYKTFEFDFVVRTNNFGFRGEDITLAKAAKKRIAVIGDSFTYGWGVPLEQTWIKLLEDNLRAAGHDVEVLNLGIPGAWPGRYAETAEDSAPVLKPDLFVIGMLQGDDLRQCDRVLKPPAATGAAPEPENPQKTSGRRRTQSALVDLIRHTLFPNLTGVSAERRKALYDYLEDKSDRKWNFIANQWKKQHATFLHTLNETEMQRFRSLPEHLQKAFENGDLSPVSLQYLIRGGGIPAKGAGGPPRLSDEFDLNSRLMQDRISICAGLFDRIGDAADSCGAEVIVLSIPALGYVAPSGWVKLYAEKANANAELENAESLVTTVPDQATRMASERAGFPFHEVTAAFRAKAKDGGYFYDYDSHFTEAGNRLFAELVTPILADAID